MLKSRKGKRRSISKMSKKNKSLKSRRNKISKSKSKRNKSKRLKIKNKKRAIEYQDCFLNGIKEVKKCAYIPKYRCEKNIDIYIKKCNDLYKKTNGSPVPSYIAF